MPCSAEPGGEVPAARRGDGRAIDDEGARGRAGDDPVRAEQDGLDVRGVRDADDRDVDAGDRVGRRVGRSDAEIGELGATAGRPVPGGDRESGPGEVGGHRRAHRAEAEERDAAALGDGFVGHRRPVTTAVAGGRLGRGRSVRRRPVSAALGLVRRRRGGSGPGSGTGVPSVGGGRLRPAAGDEERDDGHDDRDQDDDREQADVPGTVRARAAEPGSARRRRGRRRRARRWRDDDRGHDDLDAGLGVAVGDDRDARGVAPCGSVSSPTSAVTT